MAAINESEAQPKAKPLPAPVRKKKAPLSLRPQVGAQERAINTTADITVYGGAAGSGKSYMMLLRPLLQCVDQEAIDEFGNRYVTKYADPDYNAIFFRRTGPQLKGLGGLWDTAKKMYAPWKPHVVEQSRTITFASGATIQFSHMEHEKNAEDHQGLQYTDVYFDEGTHFTSVQVRYLMSRLRSDADVASSMFISCNPDPDSFLADWIDWWLDDKGFPDPEKSGIVRYYIDYENKLIFADTEQELKDNYPEVLYVKNPNTGELVYAPPKTMTFIGGTIFDNPALIEKNPGYLTELNSLGKVQKARLLYGNWYERAEGSSHFQRDWLENVNCLPTGVTRCRAWDKAASQPSELDMWPDYTAGIGMAKDKDGFFYIYGDYINSNFDRFEKSDKRVDGKFRERSGPRDTIIKDQALADGKPTTVVMSQDPGGAGKTEFQESAKKLIIEGIRVKKDPRPTQEGKLTRFLPFSSACEHGLVRIVESSFSKATLEIFYKELEAFDGQRSSKIRKDDWPDCTASAFNYLCTEAVIPVIVMEDLSRANPFAITQ